MKEIFYIEFLKYIKDQPRSWTEIQLNYPDRHEGIWRDNQNSNFLTVDSDGKYRLSFDGDLKLLRYEELKEARKSAKEARIYAVIAIGISIILGITDIIISL